MIRKTLFAAALFAASGAGAAPIDATINASDLDFDGGLDELSTPGPVAIGSGELIDFEVELIYTVDESFTDLTLIEPTNDTHFAPLSFVSETNTSLTLEAEFVGLDVNSDAMDDIIHLTIEGFGFSQPVRSALALVPDDVFDAANTVQPIPLPAAVWMLGAGVATLAGVGAARRRA